MKKIFNILATTFLASSLLISCSKGDYSSGDGQTGFNRFEDKNNTSTATTSGIFTAKINGSDFAGDKDKSSAYSITTAGITSWSLAGVKASYEAISISISQNNLEKKSYNLATSEASIFYLPPGAGSTAILGITGKVTITDLSETNIKGTFDMQGPGGFNLSEGSFDLPIIKK